MITLFQLLHPCSWVVKSCAKVPSLHEFWWKLQIIDTEVGLHDTNLAGIMLYLFAQGACTTNAPLQDFSKCSQPRRIFHFLLCLEVFIN